jgi:hypothetical protein
MPRRASASGTQPARTDRARSYAAGGGLARRVAPTTSGVWRRNPVGVCEAAGLQVVEHVRRVDEYERSARASAPVFAEVDVLGREAERCEVIGLAFRVS